MVFTRNLRERVVSGEITCSVRIWSRPHVKVGGHYPVGDGWVEVESIEEIELSDVDDHLARRSGFVSVEDLLATARHGSGQRVFLVGFRFQGPA